MAKRSKLIFDLFCLLNKSLYLCISNNNLNIKNMKAVIYARVSSTNDRQSTDRQVLDLQAYANNKGYEVVEVFTEHISGAKKNSERPVLCECLNFCETNQIDSLLISELSRLGRNVDEVLHNVRFCKNNHINIYFQKENIDIFNSDGTENPFLTIMIAVLGTCASMERENIKFRLNSGRELAKSKGVKMGRKVGSVETLNDKEQKYPVAMRCLRKGYATIDTLRICKERGEKVSLSTLKTLKKLVK